MRGFANLHASHAEHSKFLYNCAFEFVLFLIFFYIISTNYD